MSGGDGKSVPSPDPDQAWKALAQVNEWIRHGDAKLGVTLAADGVLAAVLYNLIKGAELGGLQTALSVGAGVAILTTALSAVTGVLPQLKHPGTKQNYNSLLYYRHVARGWVDRREQYKHQLIQMTTDAHSVSAQVADQLFWVARVADRKFAWATRAIACLAAAMLLTGLLAVTRLLA